MLVGNAKGECDVWDQVGEPEDEGRGCSAWVGILPYLLHIDVTKVGDG